MLASLADARDGAERIRQIVRELQVLSRVDENVHKVDLNLIIERSIRMAGTQIRQSARLVQDLGEVPPLSANETRLCQVFLNLLMNAAQGPRPSGVLHDRRSLQRAHEVRLRH